MVMTLPLLISTFSRNEESTGRRILCYAGSGAALLGVFIAATRTHAAILFWLVAVVTLSGGMSRRAIIAWLGVLALIAAIVLSDARFQRFFSLADLGVVQERFGWSVNDNVIDVISGYPLGHGLASGGTSIPYFLSTEVAMAAPAENEYARIAVEQGTVGLVLWIGFVAWFLKIGRAHV